MASYPTDSGSWRRQAACRGSAASVFFPDSDADAAAAGAKLVCMGCSVRNPCLALALRNDERDGVWGGTTQQERARIRRLRRSA